MYRTNLLNLLNEYHQIIDKRKNTAYQNEVDMLLQTIAFVKRESLCFENTNLNGHITGSAFIYNPIDNTALFCHHKKIKKWFQLGGHSDGNNNIIETVEREAKEESGIVNFKFYTNTIFDIDIHKIPEYKKMPEHLHYDIRFLLIPDGSTQLVKNKESIELKWIELNDINSYNNSDSIMRMVNKVQKLKQEIQIDH